MGNRFNISWCHVGILSRKISYTLSLCVYYDLYAVRWETAWLSKQAVLRFSSPRKINNFLWSLGVLHWFVEIPLILWEFLFFIGGEKPEIGNWLLLVKENNSNAVYLVHHGSKPDPKPISDLTPPVKPHHNTHKISQIHKPHHWGNPQPQHSGQSISQPKVSG